MALTLAGAAAWAQETPEARVQWLAKGEYPGQAEPMAADLDLDGVFDIVLVDDKRRIVRLNPKNGSTVWEKRLEIAGSDAVVFAPVAGHLLGDDTVDLALVTKQGHYFLIDGSTGDILKDYRTEIPPQRAPVLIPLNWEEREHQLPRDGIMFLDTSGAIRIYTSLGRNEPHGEMIARLPGPQQSHLAIGVTGFEGPAPHAVNVSSDGKITIVAGRSPDETRIETFVEAEGRPLFERRTLTRVWLTLGDVNGDGLDEIVVADNYGYLIAFAVSGRGLTKLWEASILREPKGPPIAIDANGDGKDDLLVTRDFDKYLLVNGSNGAMDIWAKTEFKHRDTINSPPSAFTAADGRAYAVFSDAAGMINALDLATGEIARNVSGEPVQVDAKNVSSRKALLVAPLHVFDSDSVLSADVFLLGSAPNEGQGVMASLGIAWKPGSTPWNGALGGPWRASASSKAYGAYLDRQTDGLVDRMRESIDAAATALGEGLWDEAMNSAQIALKVNPNHPTALEILRKAQFRANWVSVVLRWSIVLAILAVIAWQGALVWLRRARLARVDSLMSEDNKADAAELMLALHRMKPGNRDYLERLANIYVETKKFSGETADIFAAAHAAFPENELYVKALATAYSSQRRRDDPAAKAYSDMVRVSTHPGPWAFVLGQAYFELGKHQKALDAFQKAVRHGFDDPVMPNYLSDLYAKLSVTGSEVLPTMRRVLDERRGDPGFLDIFLRACALNRVFDEAAGKAAEWMLETDPTHGASHVVLSTRMLEARDIKGSMKHAEVILEADPNDSIGLRLLGGCYAAEKRLDESAMEIFDRALKANPEASDILVAVSHSYIQQGRIDDDAKRTYLRALDGHPDEETILRHLAQIGLTQSDDDLIIKTTEKLIDLGSQSIESVVQLAEAYCRKGVLTDRAETTYRQALLNKPANLPIASQLSKIYQRQNRVDAEAAAVYETVFLANPKRIDIGKQLALAYHQADLPERTLSLARKLLDQNPGDDEMQKLAAKTSVALDQMDSAIHSYEQVLESNPGDEEAILQLASLYGKKRQADGRAMLVYQRAVAIEPKNLEIHTALARACAEKENWDEVVNTVRHFLSNAPTKIASAIGLMESLAEPTHKSINLRWFLIETLIYDDKLADASRHLADMMRIDPEQAERALSSYDRILDKNNGESSFHQQRGRILQVLGRDAEARHSLEQARRIAPKDESVVRDLIDLYQKLLLKRESADLRFQLGKLAMHVGKMDLAISCFQQTSEDSRFDAESPRLLAQCFVNKGMLDLALQELRNLPAKEEAVKDLLYHLGRRYEDAKDFNGGREVYKMILAADIEYKDVNARLSDLQSQTHIEAEQTAIINSLSEEAQNRYEMIQELGRGAMGIVYKARDNELEEMVALKILPDSLGANPEALRRFRQEARNARRLSHKNIVRIHDIGEQQGRKYISMEFVSGDDLKARMRECDRDLPFVETLKYAKQICAALGAAEDAGIVHRDIKPANIMLTERRDVKITDFGIAKMIQDDTGAEKTQTGAIVGTPLYMSPEQVQGKSVDNRADIYSLGVVLYELASGKPPFLDGDLSYHHVFTDPAPIEREGVPEAFIKVVLKCLAKKPEERYQSPRDLMIDLDSIAEPSDAQGA